MNNKTSKITIVMMDIYSKKKCCSFHNVQYENQSFGKAVMKD